MEFLERLDVPVVRQCPEAYRSGPNHSADRDGRCEVCGGTEMVTLSLDERIELLPILFPRGVYERPDGTWQAGKCLNMWRDYRHPEDQGIGGRYMAVAALALLLKGIEEATFFNVLALIFVSPGTFSSRSQPPGPRRASATRANSKKRPLRSPESPAENVPGLTTSNGGRDFAVLLATLAELGFHDLAWRVLDSRYLGVPQRRRRVFILARRARGRRASEVLLESESGGGDFEAGREAREGLAGTTESSAVTSKWRTGYGGPSGGGNDGAGRRNEFDPNLVVHQREPASRSAGDGLRPPVDERGREAGPGLPGDQGRERGTTANGDRMRALAIVPGRLDRCAFDPKPDGPRYAACGDAVTVNVAEWIGRRLTPTHWLMEGETDG
jgi:C-5 cytosine-specific DNA methylase